MDYIVKGINADTIATANHFIRFYFERPKLMSEFNWRDPLSFFEQLGDEEKLIQRTASQFASSPAKRPERGV